MGIKDLIKRIRNKRDRIRVGYVYVPYWPWVHNEHVQKVSVISGSYSPKKSLSSRYSIKNIDSGLYSKISYK